MASQTNKLSQVRFPYIKVRLSDRDGNAFAILGAVSSAMRKAGCEDNEIAEYMSSATAGDYDHLLQTTMRWVEVR